MIEREITERWYVYTVLSGSPANPERCSFTVLEDAKDRAQEIVEGFDAKVFF
jgi:hypothetical protein